MPHSPELAEQDPEITFEEQMELRASARAFKLTKDSIVFEQEAHTCGCIDEGTPAEFRLAGNGILDPEGFDHVVAVMRQAGVTKVVSHDGCGAAAAVARHELGTDITDEQIDSFARDWAQTVATALGVTAEHQTELDRPEKHDASVIYVDTIGGFRPDRLPESFPKGFVVSAFSTSPSHVGDQVRLAASIMLGPGGLYHQKFSAEAPINIMIVGIKDPQLGHDLIEAVHQAVRDLGPTVHIEQIPVSR